MITDLTVGHPKHTLWRFLLPMFISVMFQQLYNIADSSIAGRFAGEDALAAVGASTPVIYMLVGFFMGLRSHEFNTHRAGICVLRQHDASDTYPVQYIRRWGAVP